MRFLVCRISFEDAEECLEKLFAVSTLYVTRAVIELALEQLSVIR